MFFLILHIFSLVLWLKSCLLSGSPAWARSPGVTVVSRHRALKKEGNGNYRGIWILWPLSLLPSAAKLGNSVRLLNTVVWKTVDRSLYLPGFVDKSKQLSLCCACCAQECWASLTSASQASLQLGRGEGSIGGGEKVLPLQQRCVLSDTCSDHSAVGLR